MCSGDFPCYFLFGWKESESSNNMAELLRPAESCRFVCMWLSIQTRRHACHTASAACYSDHHPSETRAKRRMSGRHQPCVKQTVEQLQIMNMHSQLAVSQVMCAAMATHGCTRTLAMAKWKNAKTVSCIKTIQPWNGYNR